MSLRHGAAAVLLFVLAVSRLDGAPAPSLTELCARIAVVTFEPGSHDLIGGGAEHRRRYLDWGLFHVEPEFLPWWRRYARALKQRNAALKSGPNPAALAPWERELAEAGEVITRLRQAYLSRLEPFVAGQGATYLSELGAASLEFRPGWKRGCARPRPRCAAYSTRWSAKPTCRFECAIGR